MRFESRDRAPHFNAKSRVGLVVIGGHDWERGAANNSSKEGRLCGRYSLSIGDMVGLVRRINYVLLTGKVVPIQVKSVRCPVSIVQTLDKQLWQGELLPVSIRIDGQRNFVSTGRTHLILESVFGVIFYHLAVRLPDLDLMRHLREEIEVIVYFRNDCPHSRIDRRR